jgi:hypothetical protein
MEDLDDIDRLLTKSAENQILQGLGVDNCNSCKKISLSLVNNYLIMDDRQEEARRIAANATPTVDFI